MRFGAWSFLGILVLGIWNFEHEARFTRRFERRKDIPAGSLNQAMVGPFPRIILNRVAKLYAVPLAYASNSSSSSVVRPVMSGSSLSIAASIAARFFCCRRKIFSSTVSRVISL